MAGNANCGGLIIDDVTLVKDATTKALKVADGVVSLPIATDSTLGGVIPDGTVITVDGSGNITVPDATDAVKGVVTVDNVTVIATSGELSVPEATTSALGVVNQATFQADSTAVDVAGIVADFNTLLGKLQTAGLMATS